MGRKYSYLYQFSKNKVDDCKTADYDDEYLTQFEKLVLHELLYRIGAVPFDDIISTVLTSEGSRAFKYFQSQSLQWMYTVDRGNAFDGTVIYTFRFPNPCHPEHYQSFVTANHRYFELAKYRHGGSIGWYRYTGQRLPKQITDYLNIDKITNSEQFTVPSIYVNTGVERLDIVFWPRSHGSKERIVITFESAYPA